MMEGIPTAPLRVACLGGGQLGRMMAMEAPRLNISMSFLDKEGCPASQVSPYLTIGSLQDGNDIQKLAEGADVVTTEIEHVNCDALLFLEENGVNVQPSGRVIQLIQDKYRQKQHFDKAGIPVAPFRVISNVSEVEMAVNALGLPLMLKARKGAYDGQGNAVLKSLDGISEALQKLGVDEEASCFDLYAEGWIDFDCEIAVMVVRSSKPDIHETRCYPAVNAIQQDSICRVVLAPARGISDKARQDAEDLAKAAIDSLPDGASGVFGVEIFVKESVVLLNEVAPRPHNTGHYTQDACSISQFENHLRAVCGMPLGLTQMKVEAAAMVNVLGCETMAETIQSTRLDLPNMTIHWYGKDSCRKGRKMGHINLTSNSAGELDRHLFRLLASEKVPLELLPSVQPSPLVGVIMGSQSDLPTMQAAVEILKRFEVPYEVDIVSAHRTPEKLMNYSRQAAARGFRVLIAGAGGAAHLPGMVASLTPLPVIGVPVKTSTLSGVDSLYSIVQMPRGIPVATVAIGNAQNAGLLAVRILSTSRPELRSRMIEYQNELKEMVSDTSDRLLDMGSDAFLEQMDSKNKSVNV